MKPPKSLSSAPRAAPNGFVVVLVLWMLGALSALLSIYAVFVIDTAAGFSSHNDRLRAEALTSAALELAAYRHLTAPAQSRPTNGRFGFRLGEADIAVEFRSEAGRIDLNAAPKPLLAGLFVSLGARRDEADVYADRIIGWRTAPRKEQDPEAQAYQQARIGYEPRGGNFPHINELSLVRGLPAALVERALPFVTVYSGRPQVNVLDAAPEVIAALPGMTLDRVNAVLVQRHTAPEQKQALLSLLGNARQYATTDGSKTLRVRVHIAFDNGQRTTSEAVILVFDEGEEPFAVLSWHDEIDGPIADGRPGLRSR
jgi:general secretion pathway protein K